MFIKFLFPLLILLLLSINGKAQLVCDAGKDTILCSYDTTMQLTLGGQPTASGGSGNYTYTWEATIKGITKTYSASDVLDDTTVSNPTYIRTTDSMFFILTVTDDSGNTCKDSVLIRFSDIISDLSSYTYWFQPGDSLQICGGLFSNISPVTPQWYPNEYITDTTAYCTYVYPEEDICYGFKITDGAGCEAYQGDKYCFIKGYFDVEEDKLNNFNISPNPFTSTLSIALPDDHANYRIQVFDIYGSAIQVDVQKNGNALLLEGSELSKGIYFLEIEQRNIIHTEKIVKR